MDKKTWIVSDTKVVLQTKFMIYIYLKNISRQSKGE